MKIGYDKLMAKYPSFFPPNFYFECDEGWYDILEHVFKTLEQQNIKVEMTQIKEKFGALRVYIGFAKDMVEHNMIEQLIDEAERKSETTCERCGKKGKIENIKGWYSCRCKHCRIMLKLNESVA